MSNTSSTASTPQRAPRVEALLSARLFVAPQLVGQRLYFISNLSGRLSLYVMDAEGSVPEPLLPPDLALQNPSLLGGQPYYVFPRLGSILVMIDQNGDENYQPMLIPIDGGFPEPAFGDRFADDRVDCMHCDPERDIAYFVAGARQEQRFRAYQANLATRTLQELGESPWGCYVDGVDEEHTRAIMLDSYTTGDHVLYLWTRDAGEGGGSRELLYGTPLEERAEGQSVPLNSIFNCHFTPGDRGVLCVTALFDDAYGLGYLPLDGPRQLEPVAIFGIVHQGAGELVGLHHLDGDRYSVEYNIDGCSWLYAGRFDNAARVMTLDTAVCGQGLLSDGVLDAASYDKATDRYALSFCTAMAPTQLYIAEGPRYETPLQRTHERVLGIPRDSLSPGEDASFTSFDGTRVSARLYLPAPRLGFSGQRPLVYYIHGGPQGQERPDFAWFSMPLIQFLTLNGFAVFVPNVRGSTGYGLAYTKRVDCDWGGNDRLDHVHAMGVLAADGRVDTKRAAVMGRSYGGYMTLTLASRHPELWAAAVDMFGPYKLDDFINRIPETWKPYFAQALGDPVRDHDFLVDRSPSTYIDGITCPLLVIQGQNDPRVIERESREVVERVRGQGKTVEYLLFPDEGHDVLKFENRVRCYNRITEFFAARLRP